jgi:hypothetical protein
MLNLTIGTVKWYRDSIRKKIGVKNKKVNLKNHLLSTQEKSENFNK